MDWDGGALDECPPVGGRRQYLHVVENECEPPRGDPSVRRVLPDALRCSIDARASVDVQPLRHALESRAWFACFAPPLETSPAAAGKRVRISVALDRTGLNVIDAHRGKNHLHPVKDPVTDRVWNSPYRQPEHIDNAGKAGLGESDSARIDLRTVQLG